MGLSQAIARQFRRPSGRLGRLVARLMEIGNAGNYQQALAHLDLQPRSRVLEIGFGPGAGLAAIARLVTEGPLTGVDFSEAMCHRAAARHAELIRQGRLELLHGDVLQLDLGGRRFDRILAVNVVYFWPEPLAVFRRLRDLLAADGLLALTFTAPEDLRRIFFARTDVFHAHPVDDIVTQLRTAGFAEVRCVSGRVKGGTVVTVLARG